MNNKFPKVKFIIGASILLLIVLGAALLDFQFNDENITVDTQLIADDTFINTTSLTLNLDNAGSNFKNIASGFLLKTTTNSKLLNDLDVNSIRLQRSTFDEEYAKFSGKSTTIFYIAYEPYFNNNQLYVETNQNKEWPGTNGWQKWEDSLRTELNFLKSKNIQNELVLEFWNEPNIRFFWDSDKNNFFELYKRSYIIAKEILPTAKIAGPGVVFHDAEDSKITAAYISDFINYAIANNVVPDYMTYHELNNTRTTGQVMNYAARLRTLLNEKKLENVKIHIGEYLSPNFTLNPGMTVGYMAAISKSPVDKSGRACWTISSIDSCFNASLNGLVDINQNPRSVYWVYKYYSALKGRVVPIEAVGIDGISVYNKNNKTIQILVGNYETAYPLAKLTINSIPTNLKISSVSERRIPFTNEITVPEPASKTLNYELKDGKLTMRLRNLAAWDASYIEIKLQ